MARGKRKSADKQGMLEQKIKDLEEVLSVLYLLRDAEENERSEKAVLTALGVDYSKFRYLVYYTDWGAHRNCQDKVSETVANLSDVMPTTCWEEDLWCDIFGVTAHTTNLASCPDDVQETIHTAIESLTEREQTVVKAAYCDDLELSEVGKLIGVGKERARQILSHAMRKLRHPRRLRYICLGQGQYVSTKKVQESLQEDFELSLKTYMLEDITLDMRQVFERKFKIAKEAVLNGNFRPYIAKKLTPAAMLVTIDELDLSIRAYNCLKRAAINTVGDICNMTPSQLKKVRNLGKKCYDEVLEKLDRLGVELIAEEAEDETDP